MKKISILLVLTFAVCPVLFAQKAGKGAAPKPTDFYSCPNHYQITSHEPGKCSICGKNLMLSHKEIRALSVSKSYSCPVHKEITLHNPGKCPKCGKKLNLSAKEQMKAEITKIYTCPMHPEVALNKEGVCPKCSKPLVEKK
ncbi:MAG TPA: heavy metal-binding domain-containing protein [Sphingobacteriaceae bacterium]